MRVDKRKMDDETLFTAYCQIDKAGEKPGLMGTI